MERGRERARARAHTYVGHLSISKRPVLAFPFCQFTFPRFGVLPFQRFTFRCFAFYRFVFPFRRFGNAVCRFAVFVLPARCVGVCSSAWLVRAAARLKQPCLGQSVISEGQGERRGVGSLLPPTLLE